MALTKRQLREAAQRGRAERKRRRDEEARRERDEQRERDERDAGDVAAIVARLQSGVLLELVEACEATGANSVTLEPNDERLVRLTGGRGSLFLLQRAIDMQPGFIAALGGGMVRPNITILWPGADEQDPAPGPVFDPAGIAAADTVRRALEEKT